MEAFSNWDQILKRIEMQYYFMMIISMNFVHSGIVYKSVFYSSKAKNLESLPSDIPYNVTNLNLTGQRLHLIPPFAFSNFSHLELLSLQENQIQVVDEDALLGLNHLFSLDLTKNKLREVPDLSSVSKSLEILVLKSNEIELIRDEILSTFKQLRILNLADNKLQEIHLDNMPRMTVINLDKNKLKQFPNLTGAGNLAILTIDNNEIHGVVKADSFVGKYQYSHQYRVLGVEINIP